MIFWATAVPISAASAMSPGEATASSIRSVKPASRSLSAVVDPTPGRSSSATGGFGGVSSAGVDARADGFLGHVVEPSLG